MKVTSIDTSGKSTVFILERGELTVIRKDTDGSRLSRRFYPYPEKGLTIGKVIAARQKARALQAAKTINVKPEYTFKEANLSKWVVTDIDITKAYPETQCSPEYLEFMKCEDATREAWESAIYRLKTDSIRFIVNELVMNELFEDIESSGFYKNCKKIDKDVDATLTLTITAKTE